MKKVKTKNSGHGCHDCKWLATWNENHGDGGPGEPMAECQNENATDEQQESNGDKCYHWGAIPEERT